MSVLLPPADRLLGNREANASYFLDVTSAYPNPNFPWTLYTSAEPSPSRLVAEVEPNGDCHLADEVLPGDRLKGAIDPVGDRDVFRLGLTEAAFVVVETGGVDTMVRLADSNGDAVGRGEDDEGHSRLAGCLPADDYCVTIHAPDGSATIGPYELSVTKLSPCQPRSPLDSRRAWVSPRPVDGAEPAGR
jgi:hypothetical protein